MAHSPNSRIIKFADDTTLTGLISDDDESGYRNEVDLLVKWCTENNLILNAEKTRELIVEFRKNKNPKDPLFINGAIVKQVRDFKLLGTYVMDNLTWKLNTDEILKKGRQRLFFLRTLKAYGVRKNILIQFYRAIIESILSSNILVWFGRLSQNDLSRLESVIRSAQRIIGADLSSLHSLYQERTLKRIKCILNDDSHPAFDYIQFLPSGNRLRTFRGSNRLTNSSYPSAVKIYNAHHTR